MKKIIIYTLIIGSILWVLWIGLRNMTHKIHKEINDFYKPFRLQHSGFILKGIDFSEANYAIYIRHEEFGEFMVIDEQALLNNQDALEIKRSWINYLPGERGQGYGIMLFKDNSLIKSKIASILKVFETGSLKNHAVPVQEHSFHGNKKEIQEKLKGLKNDKSVFIIFEPTISNDSKEFRFRIFFPTIAVPIERETDSTGQKKIKTINGVEYDQWIHGKARDFNKQWVTKIKNCIQKKAENITDFDLSIAPETKEHAYIFDTSEDTYIFDARENSRNANNQFLYLNDFMYFNYQANIRANKEEAEKLFTMDCSECFHENERRRPEVIAQMKELVKQSTKPHLNVDKGEVGLLNYKDTTTKDKILDEQKYTLSWLKTEKQKPN